MKKAVFYLVLFLVCSSCATIRYRQSYPLAISTDIPNAHALVNDSTYHLPDIVMVQRSKQDLPVTVYNDSTSKEFLVPAKLTKAYKYGNLFVPYLAPVNYLVDLTNTKRFYYGTGVRLNFYDLSEDASAPPYRPTTPKKIKTRKTIHFDEHHVNLVATLPMYNFFYMQPNNYGSRFSAGYLGFATSADYFYKPNKFISLKFDASFDFKSPLIFYAEWNDYDEWEEFYSINISFTDNYMWRRFSVGYGLNFAKNIWFIKNEGDWDYTIPAHSTSTKSNHLFGLYLDSFYYFSTNFAGGLVYRPSLYGVYPKSGFTYEDCISLQLKWMIKL